MRIPPRICSTLAGFAIAIVLPIVGMAVVHLYAPSDLLVDLPLHSLLETIGGMMALATAGTLAASQRHGASAPHWTWTSCALVGMGTLDLFHAAVPPGDKFVWLHSTATLVGGVLFLGVWLPRRVSACWARGLPVVVFLAAIAFGLVTCAWPSLVPIMIERGDFTVTARLFNMIGGICFGLASLFFVIRFQRAAQRDDWLFAVTAQPLAGAGLLFELSALWDAAWWWWHIVRLVAYAAACTFAVSKYPATESELHALNRRLTDLNRLILEETVRHWDMEPLAASSGRDALGLLDRRQEWERPVRLLLTDVHMPEMDGHMLCEQIRRRPDGAGVAIIALTSGGRHGDADRVQRLGIAAQLTKPVKASELRQVIGTVLGSAPGDVRPTSPSKRVAPVTRPTPRPLRILLAEDSLLNQKLAIGLLSKWGHTVTVAANGLEAVEAAAQQPFDLVLMDIQMPEMNGLEATEAIRRQEVERGGRVPIVALTAHALKGDRERCLEAGMDAYVSKPIRQDELYQAIAACCPHHA